MEIAPLTPELTAMRSALEARGYATAQDYLDASHMGNALVELVKGPVRIRITRDRGQWLLDIADPIDGRLWYDRVWEGVLLGEVPDGAVNSDAGQREFVLSNIDALEDAIANRPGATHALLDEWATRLLRRWHPE